MDDSEYLDAFGDVTIAVGMEGWQATIPGGYRLPVVLLNESRRLSAADNAQTPQRSRRCSH